MISNRLQKVAQMVTEGYTVADIGTDHGYVPIYLIKNNRCPKAYAMDINEGPIKMAIANIENEGLEDRIIVKQADGMKALEPGQAESVVIAGMGGELIVQILENSKVNDTVKEFILSPHKNPEILRKYLWEEGLCIVDEVMLKDAGKYYTIMKVVHGKEKECDENELLYGRKLIEKKDEVLMEYLKGQEAKFSGIYEKMKSLGSDDLLKMEEKLQNIRNTMEKMQNI